MRFFYTIDGNPVKSTKVVGYCKRYKGCMTYGLIQTHKCYSKDCGMLIKFEYSDGECLRNEERGSGREAERVRA